MNIPKKLKIGGHVVKVVHMDDLILEDGTELLGAASGGENTILLARHANGRVVQESTEEETFLHEIMHIVTDNAGMRLKEHQVNAIAAGLHQVLRDNRLCFFPDKVKK